MKICVVYIYPLGGESGYYDKAIKFLHTYHENPPGIQHDTAIVCNGTPATEETQFLFGSLPNCSFINHDGSGLDIGGYQLAARTVPCDLMVFFGSSTYFKRVGWLIRMFTSFNLHGDTIYGAMGNQGDVHSWVKPHIRTTGFWMSPGLMNRYPIKVTQSDQRYEFEHGPTGLTSWVIAQGKQPWVVAWDGDYRLQTCDHIPNGFHRGNQENLLVGDRMSSPPYYPCE